MAINRRKFIGGVLQGIAALKGISLLGQARPQSAPAVAAPTILKRTSRKNVLFIGVDDLATQLGCYGRPVVSPHLDQLAARGVRFDSAYCQYPLCCPSRSSLLTGLSPDITRVHDNEVHFRQALPSVITLPQLFRENGYFSTRVGKIYHAGDPDDEGADGLDDPLSWDWTFNPAGVDHTEEESLVTSFTPHTPLGSAIAFYRSKARDSEITDGIGAAQVTRLLKKKHDKPFFMAFGLYRPHVPWIVPEAYFDRYPLSGIQPYPFDPAELKMAPPQAYNTHPANYGMNPPQQIQAMQSYYAATSFMDAQVGQVLQVLQESGQAENTLVVFWVDHGWQLGQHGQWEKMTLFEASTRVPLIFAGAGVPLRGAVCRQAVENLDLYPTIASICGLDGVPSNLHGESLVPLLRDPAAEWSKPAITQVRRIKRNDRPQIDGYSIRDERYRYTWWNEDRDGEELYDYKADPNELKNLANDPALQTAKYRLHVALRATTLARGREPLPVPEA